MLYEWFAKRSGQLGIAASLLVWAVSLPVLALVMQANQAAWRDGAFRGAELHEKLMWLHAAAVFWSLVFVLLQLVAPLLLAFTLRATYRLRSAVCFSIGAGCAFLLDVVGLFAMLIWLRFRLGVG